MSVGEETHVTAQIARSLLGFTRVGQRAVLAARGLADVEPGKDWQKSKKLVVGRHDDLLVELFGDFVYDREVVLLVLYAAV